ncbi:MAG: flavin reductase family protein [Gemmatimonadaceae bacterium]|jgi:flavin reductase (DIM6/NTAB) family NADH-FMN oxidoreductase RutF|nr:flavin reductase family protein [Gemmatimonadaceae bacterium]
MTPSTIDRAANLRVALLRAIPGALGVLGARDPNGGARFAVVSWLTPAAHEPPLVAMSLEPDSYTLGAIRHSGVFALAFLPVAAMRTAQRLGRATRELDTGVDKAGGIMISATPMTGSPIPAEACAWLECQAKREHAVGDHILVLGEVLHAAQREDPLPELLSMQKAGWKY